MKVTVLSEGGYEAALFGISLSYDQPIEKMPEVALKLAKRGGSHAKFLESIVIWLDITAARFWWSQADTYRCGISKQSGSTMHTLLRRELKQSDFCCHIPPGILETINLRIRSGQLVKAKEILPESFLQRRQVCMNYKCLANMFRQREHHKLPQWKSFLAEVLRQIEHPEFIVCGRKEERP